MLTKVDNKKHSVGLNGQGCRGLLGQPRSGWGMSMGPSSQGAAFKASWPGEGSKQSLFSL